MASNTNIFVFYYLLFENTKNTAFTVFLPIFRNHLKQPLTSNRGGIKNMKKLT